MLVVFPASPLLLLRFSASWWFVWSSLPSPKKVALKFVKARMANGAAAGNTNPSKVSMDSMSSKDVHSTLLSFKLQ